MDIEFVDPALAAEDGALVLREAWAPPVLHYTAGYLRWQLSFPGPPPRAALARESGDPAGFMAMTPRRLRMGGITSHAYLVSFLGVRPTYQGRGLAGRLYDLMFGDLRASGLPGVVFVEAHSESAQHLLARTAQRVGLRLRRLAAHRNHGHVARRNAPALSMAAAEITPERALEAVDACAAAGVIHAAPDLEVLAHHGRDPRPRKLVGVEESGRVTAAGSVALFEIKTAQGIDHVPTLEALYLPEPTAERLSALLRAASAAFAGQATSPAVSVPSVAALDPALLRAAGLRATGAVYDAFVCHLEGHPFAAAEATTLEVA
ncbi:MAG: GNAT family N-acetyltransferase [Polyangiaceae bacterium]|nr:GNAT family N-acetyltransferase [Polyangiaceae bacterium]